MNKPNTTNTTVDNYSTHLFVLNTIINYKKPDIVVEFGPGKYSTTLFADTSKSITSIEMQSEEWYNIINNEHGHKQNFKAIKSLSPTEFKKLEYPDNIDLVFVDGHGDSRPEVINFFDGKCDTIVAHDTEEAGYGWNRVNLDSKYYKYICTKYPVFTTVYSTDKKLIEAVKKADIN